MKLNLKQLMFIISCVLGAFTHASDNNRTVSTKNHPKVLHIGFHLGCIKDFEDVSKELNINLTSWYIFSKPLDYLDGISKDFKVYNVTHDKAQRIWDRHHTYFEQFDIILISDTAPLARAFLQNNFAKPLIVWICNRFDYDHGGPEEGFPDAQYYDLFKKACTQKNVKIIGYTAYEHTYAQLKGVPSNGMIIKPFGCQETALRYDAQSHIPPQIKKKETLFLYPQLRDEQFVFIKSECNRIGIPTYSGKFNGPNDLMDFKGIIYFPYQVSNLVFFEGINRGIIFFVPSKEFFKSLVKKEKIKGKILK